MDTMKLTATRLKAEQLLSKMTPEEKIIYDRNLLIVECREDSNSLFKVMAHITENEANRYKKFRDKLAKFVINTLSLLKKVQWVQEVMLLHN